MNTHYRNERTMKTTWSNNPRRCGFDSLAQMVLLAGLFWAQGICAMPRSPLPPVPEQAPLYYEGFDEEYFAGQTDSEIDMDGFVLEESWSGYALQRVGDVIPFIVPAVDFTGNTNVSCDTCGAFRFWINPYWTSSSVTNGNIPSATAIVLEIDAVNGTQSAVAWSLQISADGNTMSLFSQTGAGLQEVLQAPISWQAGASHNVALNFGPQGSALFLDGVLAAQGSGLPSIPPSAGQLVIGSTLAGTSATGADFDEFFSFNRFLTAFDVGFYFQMTSGQAALGPMSAEEQPGWGQRRGGLAMNSIRSPGNVYDPDQDGGCPTGGLPYMTNFSAALMSNGTATISFGLAGGTNGVFYDIYSLTDPGVFLDVSQWSWVGQALTCNNYSFDSQPADHAFYFAVPPVQTTVWAWGEDSSGQTNVPVGLTEATAIAAGGYFSLALLNNGTVIGWGDDDYGEINIPSGLTNVVGIAAGEYHGVALLANGSVTNWGYYLECSVTNSALATSPPASNVVAVAAGQAQDLALLSNGTVFAWGEIGAYGTLVPTNLDLTNVAAIACGYGFNLALSSNGTVTAWGLDYSGLFNLTNVPGDLTSNVAAIAAGGFDSVALRKDGTVEAWGDPGNGVTNVPEGLSNVVSVATGGNVCLALQADGTVVAWGDESWTNIPAGMVGVKAISAGFEHSMAIASSSLPPLRTEPPAGFAPSGGSFTFSVTGVFVANVQYQWQFNGTNLTGETNATFTLTNAQASDAGSYQVIIYNTSGTATSLAATFTLVVAPIITSTTPTNTGITWFNYDPTLIVAATPADIPGYPLSYAWQLNGTNIAAASLASYMIPGLTPDNEGTYTVTVTNVAGATNATWTELLALPGMVEAWGDDTSGQCDRPASLTNIAGIAAGLFQSVAVTDSGTVVQWGKYSDGGSPIPVTDTNYASLPPTNGVVAVAAGWGQALALMTNGTVVAWGLYGDDGTDVPPNLTNVTAIACGFDFSVALLNNGTVTAWGSDLLDETNVPSGLSNVTAIAAGMWHSLALSNGTVVAWGFDDNGQTDVPPGLSNVVAIAAGGFHSLALTSDGKVVAWGDNEYGQTNVPSGMSNVMAIAAGFAHSVVLKNDGTLVAWGDNSLGQTNVPAELPTTVITTVGEGGSTPSYQTNTHPPIVVKLIAAGGFHSMAAIFSPLVQYPVDPSKDLLLIYNTNSIDSFNVCQYYLTNRPMVSNANWLGIGCLTDEQVIYEEYSTNINPQIQNWLAANPTKRPLYLLLFPDIPSRPDLDYGTSSLQCLIHFNYAANWQPFISSINMNGLGGISDCIAYINKLTNMAGTNQTLFISASTAGYTNTNWYFDNTAADLYSGLFFYQAELSVLNVNENASITYTNVTSGTARGTLAGHITNAINLAGFGSWGVHGYWWAPGSNGYYGPTNSGYVTNGTIQFSGQSSWYIIETGESFNGMRDQAEQPQKQGCFIQWFSSNAFGGTNYSSTPIGAVCNVEEPDIIGLNLPAPYFGGWAAGRIFSYCAWNSFPSVTDYLQVVGDPFTKQ